MATHARRQNGFTLVEIIIVLAVIGALMAILAPRFFLYADDAKQLQAAGDVRIFAAAIEHMYKDTGRWPFYRDGTGSLAYTPGTDAAILTSSTDCFGDDAATCDENVPDDATAGDTWDLTTAIADNFTNQLIRNRPFDMAVGAAAYRMTGKRAWKGPYLDRVSETDPWGKSYLVNIANADPIDEGPTTQHWVLVISSGRNGELETSATAIGTSDPTPGGDDILARVK